MSQFKKFAGDVPLNSSNPHQNDQGRIGHPHGHSNDSSMKDELVARWQSLLAGLKHLTRILTDLKHLPAGHHRMDGKHEGHWADCLDQLNGVLIPVDEFAFLKGRLLGGRKYHEQGEIGAAIWEVVQAQRRVDMLQHLNS